MSHEKSHLSSTDILKTESLITTIRQLLRNDKMKLDEIVDTLLSEPYGVAAKDINLIGIALNNLIYSGILDISVKENNLKFTLDTVFSTR